MKKGRKHEGSADHAGLRSYVANERQFLVAVEEGKKALREGKTVDHAMVVAAFEQLTKSR